MGIQIPQMEGAIFGIVHPIEKHWESAMVYAKMAEPMEMMFGSWLIWVQGDMY